MSINTIMSYGKESGANTYQSKPTQPLALSTGGKLQRKTIPLFKPSYDQSEELAIAECLRSGWTGLGPKVAEFEKKFAERLGVKFAIATNSGTAALQLAIRGLTRGTTRWKVITTPLTFASTAAVALHEKCELEFADIYPDTLQLDFEDVVANHTIDPYTIIIPVLYGGYYEKESWGSLDETAEIIYDCAHACGGNFDARGKLCAWSFHTVKNLSCGEGGMVTTDDSNLAERLRHLRWLGIDKSTHERTTGSYRWDYGISEVGYKAHMSDLNAAIGLCQLEKLDGFQKKREAIARRYDHSLRELSARYEVRPVFAPPINTSWHLYPIFAQDRDKLMTHLADQGIATGVHYKPLHLHPGFKMYGQKLPVAEWAFQRLVSLPMYPDLSTWDQAWIIGMIKEFYAKRRKNG